MAVITNRKAQLRKIVKEEVLRVLLREAGTPADQAKQMGLVKAPGFGNYADPNTGDITHQSKGGQLVPTKKGQTAGGEAPAGSGKGSSRFGMKPGGQFRAAQQAQPTITDPSEKDPVAGEPGTTPSTEPVRPPRADIPQNQAPANGEPKQPVQRGGPGVGDTHPQPEGPQPEGPQMPEPRVTRALSKGLDIDAIKLATSTGDTDTVKTGIDFVARIKDKIERSGGEDDRRAIPGIEKIQQKLQQQFGDAVKQSQALSSFQEKPKIGQRAMEP